MTCLINTHDMREDNTSCFVENLPHDLHGGVLRRLVMDIPVNNETWEIKILEASFVEFEFERFNQGFLKQSTIHSVHVMSGVIGCEFDIFRLIPGVFTNHYWEQIINEATWHIEPTDLKSYLSTWKNPDGTPCFRFLSLT